MWALDEAELRHVRSSQCTPATLRHRRRRRCVGGRRRARRGRASPSPPIETSCATRAAEQRGAVVVDSGRSSGRPPTALIAASRRGPRPGRGVATEDPPGPGGTRLGERGMRRRRDPPVVVVHRQVAPYDDGGPSLIVVGVDGSPARNRAVAFAAEHGRPRRAEIRLVGAVPAPAREQSIAETDILLNLAAKSVRRPRGRAVLRGRRQGGEHRARCCAGRPATPTSSSSVVEARAT